MSLSGGVLVQIIRVAKTAFFILYNVQRCAKTMLFLGGVLRWERGRSLLVRRIGIGRCWVVFEVSHCVLVP